MLDYGTRISVRYGIDEVFFFFFFGFSAIEVKSIKRRKNLNAVVSSSMAI